MSESARKVSDLVLQFIVAGMCVNRRRERARVTGEPLREEEIPRGSVDVGDRRVAECVKGVEAVEPCADLQRTDGHLDSAARDAPAREGAEEWSTGLEGLSALDLVDPELAELRHQGIGQEDVTHSPALRDLGSHPDAEPGLAIGEVDIAHVEAGELSEAKTGPESEGYNDMVSGVLFTHPKQSVLFRGRESLWGEVRHV
jgi:hypothetical protein